MKEKPSTIWIKPSTKKLLDKLRQNRESYEDIILKLLKKDNPLVALDFNGRKLYRQGVEARPFFVSIPYSKALKTFRKESSIAWFYDKKNYSYWDEDYVTQIAKEYLDKHLQSGIYLKEVIRTWQNFVDKQIKIEKEIKQLSKRSDQEIIDLLLMMYKILSSSWALGIYIEAFDPNSENIIEEVLNKHDKTNLTIQEFKILCSSEEPTNIQQELINLYQIAVDKDYSKLKSHADNFFWIGNTWADVKYFDEAYYKAKLNRLEQENTNFAKELEKIKFNLKELKQQKNEIYQKHLSLSKEVHRAIDFFQLMTNWREKRKKYALISNYYLNKLLKEISSRSKVKHELLFFAAPLELSLPISKQFVETLKQRSEFCLEYVEEENPIILSGDSAKQFVEEIKAEQQSSGERLYGNVANPGKVEGVAKVVFTTDDLHKMNKGDILVSPCTRPEYISAMKKASAILTDEGGITSHAAIVSRELGVPCIVGLRQATDLIKDGDKVIVNANHGIVTVKK